MRGNPSMNFNIYIDEVTGERLNRLAAKRRASRNSIIRDALTDYLDREVAGTWPDAILSFTGVPDMPPFESGRVLLKEPVDDPLA